MKIAPNRSRRRTARAVGAALLVIAGCSSPEGDWSEATRADSIPGYEAFLERHPDRPEAAEARARIEGLRRFETISAAMGAGTIEALDPVVNAYPEESVAAGAMDQLARLEFQRIAQVDSLPEWDRFLGRFPEAAGADEARGRRGALIQQRHPRCREVQWVRLDVREDYGNATRVRLPFEEEVAALFPHAGVQVMDLDEADAVVTIRASGEALGARYSSHRGETGGLQYTGARVAGTVTLACDGARISERFEGRVAPATMVLGRDNRSPETAPFRDAFDWSFPRALRVLMIRAFGPSPLFAEAMSPGGPRYPLATAEALSALDDPPLDRFVSLLGHDVPETKAFAARALGEMNDLRAVAALLAVTKSDPFLARPATDAIRSIARRDIGTLVRGAGGEDREVRLTAIEALGVSGDERGVGPLIKHAGDADPEIRCGVARSLGRFDAPWAARALTDLLNDDVPAVRSCARDALQNASD